MLVAEHHQVVVQMRGVQALELRRRQRCAQVQAKDFGAERRVEWLDPESGLENG